MSGLLERIAADTSRSDAMRGAVGLVVGVSPGRVDVSLSGATVPQIPVADAYGSPAIGDVVFVAKIGDAWLALTTIGKGATGGPNLVANPGFENGVLGDLPSQWSAFWYTGATRAGVFSDATSPHYGERVARIPLLPDRTQSAAQSQAFPITPGVQYRLGFWVRTSRAALSGEQVRCDVHQAPTADGAAPFGTGDVPVGLSTTTPTTGWKYVESLHTPPAGVAFGRLNLTVDTVAGTTAGNAFLDDVAVHTV